MVVIRECKNRWEESVNRNMRVGTSLVMGIEAIRTINIAIRMMGRVFRKIVRYIVKMILKQTVKVDKYSIGVIS